MSAAFQQELERLGAKLDELEVSGEILPNLRPSSEGLRRIGETLLQTLLVGTWNAGEMLEPLVFRVAPYLRPRPVFN